MTESLKALNEIIYPELEPGVINYDIINESINSGGYKGEAGRLQKLEPINYESITILRLEFRNILRIDHLWILPNLTKLSLNYNKLDKIENIEMLTSLKELDLSFNYIEKIENLDKLVKLETLSLFNNQIKKLENFDNLENLIILSVGNNQIDSYTGIERFRFLKNLRCLNLEGNPIAEDGNNPLRYYVAAFLPDLKYYNYSYIKNEEREIGKKQYFRELRDLIENESSEIEYRGKRAKEISDEIQLSSSFVEHLNEHQLFDSLFENDDEGNALRLIGEDAEDLIKEYRTDVFALTQEIYKLGLVKYDERNKEIAMFKECIEKGQLETQRNGQKIIEDFLEYKEDIFAKINVIPVDEAADDEVTKSIHEIDQIRNDYNIQMDEISQELMKGEVQLFESIEETTSQFGHIITDMMNSFIEEAQTYFVQIRDVTYNFSENLSEAVTRYVTYMNAAGAHAQVPDLLKDCLDDKDAIMNLIVGMRENHMQKIDEREDKLTYRGRNWVSDLIDVIQKEEIARNRRKIMEINYFMKQM